MPNEPIITGTATSILINKTPASLPQIFDEKEVNKFTAKKLRQLLIERGYAGAELDKCTTAKQLKDHLNEWCRTCTSKKSVSSNVIALNLIDTNDSPVPVAQAPEPTNPVTSVNNATSNNGSDVDSLLLYCFCRKTWAQCNTNMIQCENNVCVLKDCNGWFHMKCLKEKKIKCPKNGDKNPWYCPPCAVARSYI